MNGTLYFVTYGGCIHRLWKSDGSEATTVLLRSFASNRSTLPYGPYGLTDMNGTLYFSANDGVHGYELWKSDGTEAGTEIVKDINPGGAESLPPGPLGLTNVDGTLVLPAPTTACTG